MGYAICKANQLPLINKKLMPKRKPANWLQYSGSGIQMILTIMICWWIGEKTESDFDLFSKPWGQLGGLFFGIFAGMYNLINQLK